MILLYELEVDNARRNGAPFGYSVDLDGLEYYLNFAYNERIDTWFLTITTEDETVSIGPNPILTSVYGMFRRYGFEEILATGDIKINDTDDLYANADRGLDPGLDNFGFGKKLNYVSVVPDV